jgi:predicted secreted Zn-dependent protease
MAKSLMHHIAKTLIGGLTFIGLSMPVASAPKVRSASEFYHVGGKTADEIRQDMNSKSTIQENGAQYDASTKWNVKWNLRWAEANGQCEITQVKTTVDVRYVFPKLESPGSIPERLRQQWERYLAALLLHEHEHKNIGVRAAKEIESEIKNLAARRSCSQLEKEANRLGNAVLAKSRVIEKHFDRSTKHGMNDGAIFP